MKKIESCKCSFTQRMVGDGCRYCNPQYYIDILEEQQKETQRDLDALEAELEKHQWISVKHRLPEKSDFDKPVKIWTTYYGYVSEAYFSDEGEFCKEWDGKRYYSKITGVTHWMPLPQPPQEDER